MLEEIWRSLNFHKDARPIIEETDQLEENVEIAIVDSGIDINHRCFRVDDPCSTLGQYGENKSHQLPYFRKTVGVYNFVEAIKPRPTKEGLYDFSYGLDLIGHGTACASVAAAECYELELLNGIEGLSSALVSGMNPNAVVSSYKNFGDEDTSDNLTSTKSRNTRELFDQIVKNKVTVINISMGSRTIEGETFLEDFYNRGALVAFFHGIPTCQVAGNGGPLPYSTRFGLAPWTISVGACTTEGYFKTIIELEGTKNKFTGFGGVNKSITNFMEIVLWKSGKQKEDQSPLEELKLAANEKDFADMTKKELKLKLKDKIVLFDDRQSCSEQKLYGAEVGGIIKACKEDLFHTFEFQTQAPTILVSYVIATHIIIQHASARKNERAMKARFHKTKYSKRARQYCRQSSAGPNILDFDILKPDICAYGDQVLGASRWSEEYEYAHYKIWSGTSFACPIVAGVISIIRTIHPTWNPSRIKSAIMSTAKEVAFEDYHEVLSLGAGCINPAATLDPGLSYDIDYNEYLQYLIGRNENIQEFGIEIPQDFGNPILGKDLNCCSFTAELKHDCHQFTFNRRLTNLSSNPCKYTAVIVQNEQFPLANEFIKIDVKPIRLSFSKKEEVQTFTLIVKKEKVGQPERDLEYARLMWIEDIGEDGVHRHEVYSPIILAYPSLRTRYFDKQQLEPEDSKKGNGESDEFGEGPEKRPQKALGKREGKKPMQEEKTIWIPPKSTGPIRIN